MADRILVDTAKTYGANYLVTRNVADYKSSIVEAIMSAEYLAR